MELAKCSDVEAVDLPYSSDIAIRGVSSIGVCGLIELCCVDAHLDNTKWQSCSWEDITTIVRGSRSSPLSANENIHQA